MTKAISILKKLCQKFFTFIRNNIFESVDTKKENGLVAIDAIKEFSLIIDYTKTLEQLISEGKYGKNHPEINDKNFPISLEMTGKKMEISGKLFHFNRSISSDDVIFEMDKAGFRQATIRELLALGALFPDLQRQFTIVALNSYWRNNKEHWVTSLRGNDSERWVGSARGKWSDSCLFLGVRK